MHHKVYYITGVSGSGKSTIGKAFGAATGFSFYDGDDFHSESNINKMSNGHALNDRDREPWLKNINEHVIHELQSRSLIVACSALKSDYRNLLIQNIMSDQVVWIHLQGSIELVTQRMKDRGSHFMPLQLLQSQFETYEEPAEGYKIDINLDLEKIVNQLMEISKKSEIGLIGLGVMGTSLARNIGRNKFSISVYNRHLPEKEIDIAKNAKEKFIELRDAKAFDDLVAFTQSLSLPRKIMLMVDAGAAVDAVIADLLPLLETGDLIIDGGNSHYKDSDRRSKYLLEHGVSFIGTGVSGGEEGALLGPSIMPGGSEESYQSVSYIFDAIAAKNAQGEVCCNLIGKGGSGHFVKMVHNGIEYAEMQLICEIYSHLRYDQNKNLTEIAEIFSDWNLTDNHSYLLSITADILVKTDDDGSPLLDKIMDSAGNKGTGSWTTIAACELGVAIPTITAALFARYQSSYKDTRLLYGKHLSLEASDISISTDILKDLLYFCRMVNHHQGFELIKAASKEYSWNINLKKLAQTWSGGCIIRSTLLRYVREGLDQSKDILLIPKFSEMINDRKNVLLDAQQLLSRSNQSYSCINSAIDYFKYMINPQSNANLIQAQRDYFGAHTYKRIDDISGKSHHTIWTDK